MAHLSAILEGAFLSHYVMINAIQNNPLEYSLYLVSVTGMMHS